MSTIPTQNPVPSEAAKDLKFNSGKIDEFVTSMKNKYIDRFGQEHFTIEGLRWVAQQAISQFGYITLDSFQKGAEITLPNQVLRDEVTGEYYRWDGVLPKSVPVDSTPDSSGGVGIGKWISVGDASVRSDLTKPTGASMIGVQPSGNLQQMLNFVTPEQFGAIGDGVYHPLSERFDSLSEAQETYPHVTSLDQSIDWAACQAADNYARGKTMVYVGKAGVNYHLGRDEDCLLLDELSNWQSAWQAQNDRVTP
uniref:tail fiber/spike domain-containing protein n=1 Tax=Proteus vulgaris TaxID=585 RepID=UPI004062E257